MPNPASPTRTFYNDANDLMYMDIRYDQLLGISGTSGTIQKAGNISQIAWRARGRETQIYSYGYDYLSRLTTSTYYNYSDAAVVSGTNNYNENLSYDLRGNIQTLQRTGFYTNASTCTFGEIDNLTYSYTANTNRLHKVLDATLSAGDAKSRGFNGLLSTVDNSMTYDANGNLIKNLHKNVSSISYNHLNLPTVITFTSGNTIEFLYDAGGSKLRKTVKVGGVVQYVQDYLGGIEYRQTGAGVKRIESIFHAEGRYYNTNVDISNTVAWRKEYNFKDHLGNTRLVFTDRNGNGVVDITGTASTSDVLQENHYYAFGMAFEGAWLQNDPSIRDNKYQYNGKELNDDFGLNWNDYGARWYDAAIGRFANVDPLVDIMPDFSPFAFSFNNPITYYDPTGMAPYKYNWNSERYEDKNGDEVTWDTVKNYLENHDGASKDMAVLVAFPEESPRIPSNQKLAKWFEKTFGNGDGKYEGAGHAGIVIVNGETGNLRYFDFGRYNRPDLSSSRGEDEGAARSSNNYRKLRLNFNWDFKKTDDENVTKILSTLHISPLLKGYGVIIGALAKNLDYDAMIAYAEETESKGYIPFGGYTSSTACGNATYCAKFVRGVAGAGGMSFSGQLGFSGASNVSSAKRRSNSNIISIH